MSETLSLCLIFGITIPALIFVELLRYHNRATKREIFLPWKRALEMKDYERADFFYRVWMQSVLDFPSLLGPPWRWFRYRNLLKGWPESERPYHQDQSLPPDEEKERFTWQSK